ncbi:MAG: AmmeMemoRadiSam system protein A [Anaerolineaceae bacterium]|jgi:AmmeMemoRadiSam system protein A
MISEPLTDDEKRILLRLARHSIELAASHNPLPELVLSEYSAQLQQEGASFVTLTENGELRGCIGALEPYQALVQDVCEHAAAAAMDDYRFTPVSPDEVAQLAIEISRLTIPQSLQYRQPAELLAALKPDVDGVILRDGIRRATFLPQVWEKLPDPASFLSHLCQKMGAPSDLWQRKIMQVFTYQVEEFEEAKI